METTLFIVSYIPHVGPYTEIVTSYMKLTNPTDKRVGYKVKTNAPRQYTVEPNNGILEPNQQQVLSSKHCTVLDAHMGKPTKYLKISRFQERFQFTDSISKVALCFKIQKKFWKICSLYFRIPGILTKISNQSYKISALLQTPP